jgi:serine/threonine protein kinase
MRRYLKIKTNDRASSFIMILQAPIIALLLCVIFDEIRGAVPFLMAISAIWFGVNNAAREIVSENAIYKRERMFNVLIIPYVFSKVTVLGLFAIIQSLLFNALVCLWYSSASQYIGWVDPINSSIWMCYLTMVSSIFGLYISAVSNNTEKVMSIVPIAVIPQIMLAGVITKIPNLFVEFISYFTFSRWGTEGFNHIQNNVVEPMPKIQTFANNPGKVYIVNKDTLVDACERLNYNFHSSYQTNFGDLSGTMKIDILFVTVLGFVSFIGIVNALRNKDSFKSYIVKDKIGEGGMGIVYLAEHVLIGRRVAIKCLHSKYFDDDSLRLRFRNEAKSLAELRHPNIVTFLDYVEDNSGLYIIMEYIKGQPLDEYIKKTTGPIPYIAAFPLMSQILGALSYSHSKGIIHRDIKPSNILITPEGDLKILDFGIAKTITNIWHNITTGQVQLGTTFYMSPEQVQAKEIDLRTDIYSTGVTFFQMVTGINPYSEITSQYDVQAKIVNEVLPLASSVYIDIPEFVDDALAKATSKSKDARFQTCDEFLEALTPKADSIQEVVIPMKVKNWHINMGLIVLSTCFGFVLGSINSRTTIGIDSSGITLPDAENPFVGDVKGEVTENDFVDTLKKKVVLKNMSQTDISVAYAFYNGKDWAVNQWITLKPEEPIRIEFNSEYTDKSFYLYACDLNGNPLVKGDNVRDFCTRPTDRNFTQEYSNDGNCEFDKGSFLRPFILWPIENVENEISFE